MRIVTETTWLTVLKTFLLHGLLQKEFAQLTQIKYGSFPLPLPPWLCFSLSDCKDNLKGLVDASTVTAHECTQKYLTDFFDDSFDLPNDLVQRNSMFFEHYLSHS